MTKETGTPPDWARICSEIVVAAYGTKTLAIHKVLLAAKLAGG